MGTQDFLFQLSELLSVPAVTGAEKTGTLYSDEDYRLLGQSPSPSGALHMCD